MPERAPKSDPANEQARNEAWGVDSKAFADGNDYLAHRPDTTHESIDDIMSTPGTEEGPYAGKSLKDLAEIARQAEQQNDKSTSMEAQNAIQNKLDQLVQSGQISEENAMQRIEQLDKIISKPADASAAPAAEAATPKATAGSKLIVDITHLAQPTGYDRVVDGIDPDYLKGHPATVPAPGGRKLTIVDGSVAPGAGTTPPIDVAARRAARKYVDPNETNSEFAARMSQQNEEVRTRREAAAAARSDDATVRTINSAPSRRAGGKHENGSKHEGRGKRIARRVGAAAFLALSLFGAANSMSGGPTANAQSTSASADNNSFSKYANGGVGAESHKIATAETVNPEHLDTITGKYDKSLDTAFSANKHKNDFGIKPVKTELDIQRHKPDGFHNMLTQMVNSQTLPQTMASFNMPQVAGMDDAQLNKLAERLTTDQNMRKEYVQALVKLVDSLPVTDGILDGDYWSKFAQVMPDGSLVMGHDDFVANIGPHHTFDFTMPDGSIVRIGDCCQEQGQYVAPAAAVASAPIGGSFVAPNGTAITWQAPTPKPIGGGTPVEQPTPTAPTPEKPVPVPTPSETPAPTPTPSETPPETMKPKSSNPADYMHEEGAPLATEEGPAAALAQTKTAPEALHLPGSEVKADQTGGTAPGAVIGTEAGRPAGVSAGPEAAKADAQQSIDSARSQAPAATEQGSGAAAAPSSDHAGTRVSDPFGGESTSAAGTQATSHDVSTAASGTTGVTSASASGGASGPAAH
jgi:hypothetical protein